MSRKRPTVPPAFSSYSRRLAKGKGCGLVPRPTGPGCEQVPPAVQSDERVGRNPAVFDFPGLHILRRQSVIGILGRLALHIDYHRWYNEPREGNLIKCVPTLYEVRGSTHVRTGVLLHLKVVQYVTLIVVDPNVPS